MIFPANNLVFVKRITNEARRPMMEDASTQTASRPPLQTMLVLLDMRLAFAAFYRVQVVGVTRKIRSN